MGQAAASAFVSLVDYFETEVARADDAPRREWFDGVVYAMSRGTPEHGLLTSSITIALGNALPADCRLYSGDTMLFIERAQLCTYADLSVVCGERETFTVRKNGRSLGQAVTNPAIIVEALSEATERRGERCRDGKFQAYKQLASLREYRHRALSQATTWSAREMALVQHALAAPLTRGAPTRPSSGEASSSARPTSGSRSVRRVRRR